MSINIDGAAQASLTVFAGLCTEQAAVDLPEGVSPDCQDIETIPGSVYSRRCLSKVPSATFLGGVTLTYGKSYTMPNGDVRNLWLDSAGNLWWNDVTNGGGVQLLAVLTPGSYGKSITAFGREYIAIIDLLHGADVPLQWDGTFLDRVTQDGPGAPPTIANLVLPAVAGAGSPTATLVRLNNVVTATTASAHGLKVGYQAQITGLSAQPIGFTQTITINNEDNPGIATVKMTAPHGIAPGIFVSIQAPPAVSLGGGIAAISWAGGIATVTLTAAAVVSPGAQVTIAGTTNYNGTWTVLAVLDATDFTFAMTPLTAPGSESAGTASSDLAGY